MDELNLLVYKIDTYIVIFNTSLQLFVVFIYPLSHILIDGTIYIIDISIKLLLQYSIYMSGLRYLICIYGVDNYKYPSSVKVRPSLIFLFIYFLPFYFCISYCHYLLFTISKDSKIGM